MQQAMNYYRHNNYNKAALLFGQVANLSTQNSNTRAKALHYLGKSQRRSGKCSKAIISFDKLFKLYPHYPQKADAQKEQKACRIKLGF
jgi:TolA-binding protein